MRLSFLFGVCCVVALSTADCVEASRNLCSSGKNQSPISFENTAARRNPSLRPIQLSHSCKISSTQPLELVEGPSGVVAVLKGSQLCTARDPLTSNVLLFDHMELHRGPEHVFSEIAADMEVQLYFRDSGSQHPLDNNTRISQEGGPLVALAIPVVCMRKLDDDMKISQFLDMFVQQAREKNTGTYNASHAAEQFNTHTHGLLHLIPTSDRGYMSYTGSLTSPPCTEGVSWYVFTSPLHVRVNLDKDAQALLTAEHLQGHNHRPVQPLNDRMITRYIDPIAHSESRELFGKRKSAHKATHLLGSTWAVILALSAFVASFVVALYAFHYCSHIKNTGEGEAEGQRLTPTGRGPRTYGSV